MNQFIAKVKVVATQAVTIFTLIAVVAGVMIAELTEFSDVAAVDVVINLLLLIVTVLGVASRIIRRVTPVLASERGILPVEPQEADPGRY